MDIRTINVEEVSRMIEVAMKIINNLPENSIKENYSEEIAAAIADYNREVALLKLAMENHFMKEKTEGIPPSLSLRRAYQNLRFL